MHLTPAQLGAYRHDGYILQPAVFSSAELELLRAAVEAVVRNVTEHATRPEAGPELRLADGHRLQFSQQTVIPTAFLADPHRIDARREVRVEVPAGSLLIFPSLLLHRSSPNTSDRQRRACCHFSRVEDRPSKHWRGNRNGFTSCLERPKP